MGELHPVEELNQVEKALAKLALKARKKAYAPYSKYLVGCAVLDSRGKVHTGCNVENASYSATLCAERVALSKMVTKGSKDAKLVVLATSSDEPIFPCGVCLQVIRELAGHSQVIALNKRGTQFSRATVKDLYPYSFSREQLEK